MKSIIIVTTKEEKKNYTMWGKSGEFERKKPTTIWHPPCAVVYT